MNPSVAVALALAASALAAAPLQSPETSAARAADEAQLRRIKTELWPNFYRQQDMKGLAAFLADSFVIIGPQGEVSTRADALEDVAAGPWSPANFTYTVLRIDWHGADLVTITGRGESDRASARGEPCRHRYISSNLLRRAPAAPLGWQALSSHVSGVACEAV
ncbi:MAG: hypothetical protein Kow00133_12410 [Amphiplicatus sp.]